MKTELLPIGCIFDSAYGVYNFPRVIALAVEYGFKSEFSATDLTEMNPNDLSEKLNDVLMDEIQSAESFLSAENICPENHYFAQNENGDYGVWPSEDDDSDDDITDDECEECGEETHKFQLHETSEGNMCERCLAKNNPDIDTYTLPEYWASGLINNDCSGMSAEDVTEMNQWLANVQPGSCTGCSEQAWFSHNNDANNMGGNVLEYHFRNTAEQNSAEPSESDRVRVMLFDKLQLAGFIAVNAYWGDFSLNELRDIAENNGVDTANV
jgi:hypothetical protein